MNVTATYLVHRQQETKLQWQIEHPRFLSLCSTELLHSVLSEDYISVYGTSIEVIAHKGMDKLVKFGYP